MAPITHALQDCIDACNACAQLCAETMRYCLQQGGKHATPQHISLLIDCIELCKLASSFMTRNSEHYMHVCSECADICDRCAASCGTFDDPVMRACADACIDCAAACREMSRAQVPGNIGQAEA
jgi:hypothetical protein